MHEAGAKPAFYNGVWETKGRSVLAASYIVLFGVGTLYFTASNILSVPIGFFSGIIGGTAPEDVTLAEKMSYIFTKLAFPIQVILLVSQFAFLLVPTIILTKKLHTTRVREYLRYRRVPVVEIILAVVITVAMMPFVNFIANEITRWLEVPEWFTSLGAELFSATSFPEFIWLAIVIGVTPAICEEALFRGYAQRTMERKLGAKSVWIVGILFGLYHFNPIGLISLAMMGVIFGYYFYRSKSIFPGMAAHFTNNFLVVYFLYADISIGGVRLATLEAIPLWVVGLSAALSALLLYAYYMLTQNRRDPFPDEEPLTEPVASMASEPPLD